MQRLHTLLTTLIMVVLSTMIVTSCSDTDGDDGWGNNNDGATNTNRNDTSREPALARLEFPHVKGGNSVVIINSTPDSYGINYSVEWDIDKKSQRWSAYQLNTTTLKQNTTRYYSNDDQYPFDPHLTNGEYLPQDYFWGSGFDHGHICPSADRLYSKEANRQTFYLTNMQPQYKQFNASDNSPWYRLEGQVRSWANAASTEMLYVVKGGTIEDNQIITKVKGELRVPKYFFVALLLKNASGYKAIGFWMEHQSSYPSLLPLSTYAVNIRQLEQNTGIDFFCNLPDDVEQHVETLPVENIIRAWKL